MDLVPKSLGTINSYVNTQKDYFHLIVYFTAHFNHTIAAIKP